jgi:hypothetical protein
MDGWMDGRMDGSNGKDSSQAAIHPSERIILVAWLAQDTILFNSTLHVRVLLEHIMYDLWQNECVER